MGHTRQQAVHGLGARVGQGAGGRGQCSGFRAQMITAEKQGPAGLAPAYSPQNLSLHVTSSSKGIQGRIHNAMNTLTRNSGLGTQCHEYPDKELRAGYTMP